MLTAVLFREGEGFVARDPKVEGWYLTNDRVELNGRSLRVLGRSDRLVKILGELVDLEGVEHFWQQWLGGGAAVVAQDDERRGVTLHLFHEGPERNLAQANRACPGPERLTGWHAMKKLPRSALGKVDRAVLRDFLRKIHQE